MFEKLMARMLALTVGSALVLSVSACAFSGPGTHVGGDGFTDVGAAKGEGGKAKPTPPPEDDDDDDLPVLK